MQRTHDPYEDDAGGRRPLSHTIRLPDERDLQALLDRQSAAVDRRLEEGLRDLRRATADLMRQVTAELRRAGREPSAEDIGRDVARSLVQDAGLRQLLARADQRVHALAERMEQLEDAVRRLAEATRDAVRQAAGRAGPATDFQGAREGAEALAQRLSEISERVEGVRSQQRDDLVRLARGLAKALRDITARSDEGFRAIAERDAEERGRLRALEERHAADRETLRAIVDHAVAQRETLQQIVEHHVAERQGIRALAEQHTAEREAIEEVARQQSVERASLEEAARALTARLERLEAAVAAEHDRAGRAAAELPRAVRELAERTDATVARAREDLAALIEAGAAAPEVERLEGEVLKRLEEGAAEVAARLEAIQASHATQRQTLAAYIERTGRGLTEVSRRIQEGFRAMADQAGAASAETLVTLEAALARSVDDLKRSVEGFTLASGEALGDVRADIGERVERARAEAVEGARSVGRLVTEQSRRQQRALEAVTGSLQSLLESVRRAGSDQRHAIEGIVWAFAGRQEALLDETLASLRSSVESLPET